MGADLLLAVCRAPRTADGQPVGDSPELLAALHQRVADLPESHLTEVAELRNWDCEIEEDESLVEYARKQVLSSVGGRGGT